MNKDEGSIVVISDTHLGLRPSTLYIPGFKNTLSCEPKILSDFLNWLKILEEGEQYSIKLSDNRKKRLLPPSELILLGDIIELWDASNRAIEFCSRDFNRAIAELECEKVYLLGNHDDILKEVSTILPSGTSSLNIVTDIYPKQDTKPPYIMRGARKYVFLHGHQFDSLTQLAGPFTKILAWVRDGAEAFGTFSWLIVGIFVGCAILWRFNLLKIDTYIVGLLGLLSLPRILISLARPIWNKLVGKRYKQEEAVKGFYNYWRKIPEEVAYPPDVNVVYGHTHLTDIITPDEIEEIIDGDDWKPELTLLNIPSWVKDQDDEGVLLATFLYIDDEGAIYVGWDWNEKKPFLISDERISDRVYGVTLDEEAREALATMGWPEKLADKWSKPYKYTRKKRGARKISA
jgi:UDP-2,3-diacylglucosamine pyrophosphatase LpxH